ncbi:MAG TPA: hypothetical protein VF802_09950 [Candidatus Limnocylindrales bacterium]
MDGNESQVAGTAEAGTAGEASRSGTMSMADYEEAMEDRNVHARARGLAAPYIAGGRDPDPERGRAQDRFYLRLLAAMVLLIVVGGLVLSILVYVVTGGGQ